MARRLCPFPHFPHHISSPPFSSGWPWLARLARGRQKPAPVSSAKRARVRGPRRSPRQKEQKKKKKHARPRDKHKNGERRGWVGKCAGKQVTWYASRKEEEEEEEKRRGGQQQEEATEEKTRRSGCPLGWSRGTGTDSAMERHMSGATTKQARALNEPLVGKDTATREDGDRRLHNRTSHTEMKTGTRLFFSLACGCRTRTSFDLTRAREQQ